MFGTCNRVSSDDHAHAILTSEVIRRVTSLNFYELLRNETNEKKSAGHASIKTPTTRKIQEGALFV